MPKNALIISCSAYVRTLLTTMTLAHSSLARILLYKVCIKSFHFYMLAYVLEPQDTTTEICLSENYVHRPEKCAFVLISRKLCKLTT